jgi:hypothetical protein
MFEVILKAERNPMAHDPPSEVLSVADVAQLMKMAKSGELAKLGILWVQVRHADGTVEDPVRIPEEFREIAAKVVQDAIASIRSEPENDNRD